MGAKENPSLDPEKARAFSDSSRPRHKDSCSMRDRVRAARTLKRVREGKGIQLLISRVYLIFSR